METANLFGDEFLEDMADQGIEVIDLFDILGDTMIAYDDYRRRVKLRVVMSNYPSAFDRHGEDGHEH